MKKILIVAILTLAYTLSQAQTCQLEASDYGHIQLAFSTPDPTVEQVSLQKQTFDLMGLAGFTYQNQAGRPALPTLVKVIEIAVGNGLNYSIDSILCDTLDGAVVGLSHPLLPAQPSRSKSDTSALELQQDNNLYSTDAFCGAPLIELEAIGAARDRNLATVSFNPIRWNPVTNEIIIVRKLRITISQTSVDLAATQQLQRHWSPVFGAGIETLNTLAFKDSHTQCPLRYTIVAHSMFRGALDEFAAWKRRKGFLVDLVYTDEPQVGATFQSIKAYLKSLYDTASAAYPAPTFVLLVGDVAQIPAEYVTANNEHHYSDLNYCCWTDNDYLPDCYYGRFSAQNLSQLEPQISKTLLYEQYTFPDDSYLNVGVLIAGVDGGYAADNAYHYADPSMDYIAKTYITSANGFSSIYYYKNNTNFAPAGVTVTGSSNTNTVDAELRDLYNSGCGWVNYSAHGDKTNWHKPYFNNTHVSQMTNVDKPQIMIGNCCLSNSFQVDACLGEALLRKDNNAGAVAYIGGSNSTYWTEDFYWSVGVRTNISNSCDPTYDANNLGMYDKLFHQHNESFSKWFFYMGATIYAGNMAVQSSSSNLKKYYWQIYHLMGDPALMPYNKGQAQTMTPTIPSTATIGISTLTLTATPYAYVALKNPDGKLVAAAFANGTGYTTLSFPTLHTPGTYEIAISAQNYKPYFHNLEVYADGPYVTVSDITPTGNAVAGNAISFDLTLTNMGTEATDSLFVEFLSPTGQLLYDTIGWRYVTSGLAADQQIALHGTGSGLLLGTTPDGTDLPVKIRVRWGSTSATHFATTYFLPVANNRMEYHSHTIVGATESDDTVLLTITNINNGHAALTSGALSILCLDPVVNFATTTNVLTDIAPGEQISHTYTLTFNGPKPVDRAIPVIQYIDNGFLTHADTILLLFGVDNQCINFDDTTWGNVSWTQGEYPWELTTTNPYSGSYCARSRTWSGYYGSNSGNNCSSELTLVWTSSIDDSLTFFKKVSSENSYDFYHFYIDGILKEELSGTYGGWSRSAYFIPAGTHTFKWSYDKDYSQAEGSDCAFLDDITLPLNGTKYIYQLDSICMGDTMYLGSQKLSTNGLDAGYHHFADTAGQTIYYLTLYLAPAPVVSIDGGDVTIRQGETVLLTATGANSYLWSNGLTTPAIEAYPAETTTYSVTGSIGRCTATASTTVAVDGILIGIDKPEHKVLHLYPNPAHHLLTVEGADIDRIVVRNLLGQTLIDQTVRQEPHHIDLTQLPEGLYLLQAYDSHNRTVGLTKFLKK